MADNYVVFKILNPDVVKRLVRDGKVEVPKKKVDIPKDKRWNEKQMTSKLIAGIEAGKPVQDIAENLKEVIGNNEASAIRNARTMFTSAENHGRLDSYRNLDSQGVVMKKQWEATPDDRTRPSHIDIDGEEQDLEDKFSNGCMFPADGNGPAEEVWCCRCAMGTHIIGFRRLDGSISYVEYEPDETLHEQQMRGEKIVRITTATMKAAKTAEAIVTKNLMDAVKAGNGHLEGLDFRLKGRDSLQRKIVEKSAKKGMTPEAYSKEITDVLRYTNVSPSATFTSDFYTVKGELEKKGYSMIEVENTIWKRNVPYRGINTLVQTPSGYTFELQFHTAQSLEIKEINHELYDIERLASTPKEEKERLQKAMKENAKKVITPKGSSKIIKKEIDKPIKQW